MEDIYRQLTMPFFGLVVFVAVVVLVGLSLRSKNSGLTDEERGVATAVCLTLIIFAVLGFGGYAVKTAVVNKAPQSVIDRSVANERADILRNDSKTEPKH
ncbi:MAG: hypothetical protein WCT32_04250 [Patescibacteria group bacterium]|jgi:hypothetical protein